MFKKIALGLGLLGSVLVFSGCSVTNKTSSDKMLDVSRIEKFVTPGKTTLAEVRELVGTPGLTGKTLDGRDFVAYAIVGERGYGEGFAKGAADVISLGLYSDDESYFTQKNIYFLLDNDKVVQDIKYNGYTYIIHWGTFFKYNLCEKELSDQELRSTNKYSLDYIVDSWKKDIVERQSSEALQAAAKEKKTLDKLDYDDVHYSVCGFSCYLEKGAIKAYGQFTNGERNTYGGRKSNDGSKKALLGL